MILNVTYEGTMQLVTLDDNPSVAININPNPIVTIVIQ